MSIQKITTPAKNDGDQHTALEYNAFRSAINANADELQAAQTDLAAIDKDYSYGILVYASTVNWAYDKASPNKRLTVGGNCTINLSGTADGDCGILKITKVAGSEVVTFPGNVESDKELSTGAGETDIVAFMNVAGTIFWCIANFGTAVITPQLSTPTLTVSTISASQINLSWGSVSSATNYIVERSENAGFASGVAQIYSGSGTSYSDTGRASGTTYYYRIKAQASGFTDSAYGTANATTSGTSTQLATPSLSATAASSSQINLSWGSVTNATGYEVQRSTNSSFTSPVTVYTGSGTSFNDTGLTSSTQYYYRIKATAVGYTDSAYGTANATTQSGTSFDSDAQAFITAANITDSTQRNALNQLVLDLKAGGVWAKMKAVYPFVGGSAASHKFNLKNPLDTDAAFRLTFAGSLSHTANGIEFTGNGRAETHLIPSTDLSLNDTHISYYGRADNSVAGSCAFGCQDGSGSLTLLPNNSGNLVSDQYNGTAGRLTVSNPVSRGFYISSRIANNDFKVYKSGSSVASTANSGGALPGVQLVLFGLNNNGSFINYLQMPCAGATVGQGLTSSEASALNNAFTTFNTTLSRAIA